MPAYAWLTLLLTLAADLTAIAAAEAAAAALAAGGIPEAAIGFEEAVVGPFGAGFAWSGQASLEQRGPGFLGWDAAETAEVDSDPGDFMKVSYPGALALPWALDMCSNKRRPSCTPSACRICLPSTK